MERQEASGVATVTGMVTGRFLLTGLASAPPPRAVPASATRPHKEIDYR